MMTKKKFHAVSSKSKNEDIEEHANLFPDEVSNLAVSSLHFFDETSVTKPQFIQIKVDPKGRDASSSRTCS